MRGAFSARCSAHRVPCITLSARRIVPSALRTASFALRSVLAASRITFPASRDLHPAATSKTFETDSKPLIRLR